MYGFKGELEAKYGKSVYKVGFLDDRLINI